VEKEKDRGVAAGVSPGEGRRDALTHGTELETIQKRFPAGAGGQPLTHQVVAQRGQEWCRRGDLPA
jgi:hypothetical protein